MTELGRAETPWIRSRSTRADVRDHFASILEHHVLEDVATQIERILIDGSDAVLLGEIRQTARSTGRAYRARLALHLTVTDGLITRHHIYEDSLAVAQAFPRQWWSPRRRGDPSMCARHTAEGAHY